MAKFHQGKYEVQNPEKYIGKGIPTYRSSWELHFMRMCDNHPAIVGWASEPFRIPYRNPFNNKYTTYVPDFFMIYEDSNGKRHADVVEVKPEKHVPGYKTKSNEAIAAQGVNEVKWQAASQWCRQQGLNFRLITENDIFNAPRGSKRKKRK